MMVDQSNNAPVVIIGTGLAGYTLAKEFRKHDSQTPLMMLTNSAGRFYSKPLLSRALRDDRDIDQLTTATAEKMSKELNADIKTQVQVTRIDSQARCVYVGEQAYPYRDLVLALGADVIRPPLTGNAVTELFSVNDLMAYERFREHIKDKKRIGILGAGFVGVEFANDLAHAGHEVDVIDLSKYPLQRWLPLDVARVLQEALADLGVHWHLGKSAQSIDRAGDGLVVSLMGGSTIKVDMMLSAVGLKPHVDLAQATGLDVDRGIVVDQYLRTSDPHIYALGDCAEVNGFVLLFVSPLRQCSQALAKTLAGEQTAVRYPAMSFTVKTTACPIALATPPKAMEGSWTVEGHRPNLKALFYDEHQKLRGFALTGTMVKERMLLSQKMDALME